MRSIYLAGPCFSTADREFLKELAKRLEETMWYIDNEEGQVKVFLPHLDAGDWSIVGKQKVFEKDTEALTKSEVIVAVLDGADVDSGTAGEMGIAWAQNKLIIGYCTDLHRRGKTINALIFGFLSHKEVFKEILEIQNAIRQYYIQKAIRQKEVQDGKDTKQLQTNDRRDVVLDEGQNKRTESH